MISWTVTELQKVVLTYLWAGGGWQLQHAELPEGSVSFQGSAPTQQLHTTAPLSEKKPMECQSALYLSQIHPGTNMCTAACSRQQSVRQALVG